MKTATSCHAKPKPPVQFIRGYTPNGPARPLPPPPAGGSGVARPALLQPVWHTRVVERLHCPHPACPSNTDPRLFGVEMQVCIIANHTHPAGATYRPGWYRCEHCQRQYELRTVELEEHLP